MDCERKLLLWSRIQDVRHHIPVRSLLDHRFTVKQIKFLGISMIWGGNSLAGNQCQRRLKLFTGFGRYAWQPPGRWGGCEGRHRGEERVKRSEERVRQSCLSGTGSGTGGTWSGWTPSIGHLSPISTPGRRGMLLGGGVAGAEPPHKGGPNRPDRPEMQWSVVSGLTTGWDGSEDWTRVSRYVVSTKEYPHLGCTRISGLNLQGGARF